MSLDIYVNEIRACEKTFHFKLSKIESGLSAGETSEDQIQEEAGLTSAAFKGSA